MLYFDSTLYQMSIISILNSKRQAPPSILTLKKHPFEARLLLHIAASVIYITYITVFYQLALSRKAVKLTSRLRRLVVHVGIWFTWPGQFKFDRKRWASAGSALSATTRLKIQFRQRKAPPDANCFTGGAFL